MFTKQFNVRTSGRDEMIDITAEVAAAVADSGLRDGLVTVFVSHTTAGVTINENADPDVIHDVLTALDKAVPWSQPFYRHGEGNSAAHVKSSMVGSSASVPLIEGRMQFGTWQSIFFCEFDGPRTRKVTVSVIGTSE